jgi:hypothetical protein
MREMERCTEMSDDIVMEDVYAKLAKARETKAAGKQEQVAEHKLKPNVFVLPCLSRAHQ